MPFTGDLEQLNIADIIQLLNTTRKSGVFSVKSSRGESRIIFSNGCIVGANHLDNKVRIGTVLVNMKAITVEDLRLALDVQKKAGKDRKPLIETLMGLGKLGRDEAFRALKKLIDITVVELISWTKGTFTLDTDVVDVSPEVRYPLSKMEQEISLDAQMVLMDTLRVFDERERDRRNGKTIVPDEEYFADVIPPGDAFGPVITADDLGLGDLDRLERKIPDPFPVREVFDPVTIHRQKIEETLSDFPADEREAFVSFLEQSTASINAHGRSGRWRGLVKALVLVSEDELIKHSIMTICKDEGVLVFSSEGEKELFDILDECIKMRVTPVLVFDSPQPGGVLLSKGELDRIKVILKERYPMFSAIQLASPSDYTFTLQSLRDGMTAVFPKPPKGIRDSTFIRDTIEFLASFSVYVTDFFLRQKDLATANSTLGRLKDRVVALRQLTEPSAIFLALLKYVSETFERAITFIVRPAELAGEKAVGVYDEKDAGPTSVTRLKIPLSGAPLLRQVVEKGQLFYGPGEDEALQNILFQAIGEPASSAIMLLPVKRRGETVALIYGDFGGKEASSMQCDEMEILAHEAGLVLESALYRKELAQAIRK
jgi:hypothetical protein